MMIVSLKLSSRNSRSFLYSRMDPSASLGVSAVLEAAAAWDCCRSASLCSSSVSMLRALKVPWVPSVRVLKVPPVDPVLAEAAVSGDTLGFVAARVAFAAAMASSAAASLSRLEAGSSSDSPEHKVKSVSTLFF